MTRSQLVDSIQAQVAGMTKLEAEKVVETIFDCISEAFARGERTEIRGFGSFSIRERKAKIGRNPKLGVPVAVPAKRVPFFKVGDELRERVDRGNQRLVVKANSPSPLTKNEAKG